MSKQSFLETHYGIQYRIHNHDEFTAHVAEFHKTVPQGRTRKLWTGGLMGLFTSDAKEEPKEQKEFPDEQAAGDASPSDAPADETPQVPKTPEEERQDLIGQLQRLQAEFDNYRKRVERDQVEQQASSNDKIMRDLLPIVDNFQLSLQHAKDEHGAVKGDDLLAGVNMIHDQLNQFLERHGLQVMETDGQKFDPRMHEALMTVAQEGAQRGIILQTFSRGFVRNGKTIRPAKVSVAK